MRAFTQYTSPARASRRWVGACGAVGLLALTAAGCSETVRTGQASSYLILDRIEAASGMDQSSVFTGVLRSDVATKGSVYEDNGRVTLRLAMKDVSNPTGPTTNNQITINRYRVEYRRTDGRNAPGVDVPYASTAPSPSRSPSSRRRPSSRSSGRRPSSRRRSSRCVAWVGHCSSRRLPTSPSSARTRPAATPR
jgi:hypothetical protein